MRVLLLLGNPNENLYNPNSAVGGALLAIKSTLESEGYQVSLSQQGEAEEAWSSDKGINPSPNGFSTWLKKTIRKLFPGFYLSLGDWRLFNKQNELFKHLLEAEKTDVIIEFLAYGSDIGSRLSKARDIPLITIFDSPLNEQFKECNGRNSWWKNRVGRNEKRSLEKAVAVICYSNPVKLYLKKKYALNEKDFHLFPTINWNKLVEKTKPFNEKALNIGFIGSFLKWHKVELLVNAFANIAAKHPEVHLYLVGYGQEWELVKKEVDSKGLSGRITMTGFVSDEELVQIKNNLAFSRS